MLLAAERNLAREHAERLGENDRVAHARAFGYAVVAAWWAQLTATDRKPQPLRALPDEPRVLPDEPHALRELHALREPTVPARSTRLERAAAALARRIGASLAVLDAETAAHQIGLAYIGLLPQEHRAVNGVHYTPPPLGALLIERATAAGVDWRTARVLDPACGGGAFLAPVARCIMDALGPCEPRLVLQNVAARVRGYEIDPFAAWLSQVALDAALLPVTRACGRSLPNVVTVCDTLRAEPPPEPFDLVIGNPPYARVRLGAAERRRFERSLFGHANLYGLFTDVAIRHVKPGGVVAFVTPTSFLAGEYSKKLRALLGREAPPFSFDFVTSRDGVFEGVLQETLLATYRRAAARGCVAIRAIGASPPVEPVGDASLPADPARPWILPRTRDQVPLAALLSGMPHRLADWGYTVSTGPLVWNRYKDQLAVRAARNRRPIVWAEAVTADGRFAWRAHKRDHAPYFTVRPGDEWMIVRNPCVLLQRTTSKEQPRRLIAATLPADFLAHHGAVVVENHLNMIRPATANPPVSHEVLAAFLNGDAADRAFRCVSGSVAVSAYELESLPLPDPGELEPLRRLIAARANAAAIEAECDRLYGVGFSAR